MIPDWLVQKLASPPEAGAGIHAWLFSTARQLHAHMPPAAVSAALQAATVTAARRVTAREIRDAVANSREVAWKRTERGVRGGSAVSQSADSAGAHVPAPDSARWPAVDDNARQCRIAAAVREGIRGAADLWESSPVRMDGSMSADDWVDWLFPEASFLCLATDHPATARSRPPAKWYFGPADSCGLVVPSPMTAPSGKALDGTLSHRCLGNTAPRRWLVIEFDTGTRDEQAALHWHLRAAAAVMDWPHLALVVSSGGKSLHGWYGPCHSEDISRELMAYARTLGADTATWNRSQLVRLPEGLRKTAPVSSCELPEGWRESSREVRQAVLFWDPDAILWKTGNENFTPHAGPPDTPPILDLQPAA